jgi:hypothetical protein
MGGDVPVMNTSAEPKKNIFQRIQSGVQKMNRGKPKGQLPHSKKNKGKKGRGSF